MNRNKLDVTLDLTHPEGVALLKRLVAGAHAVIENYSSEVLRKLRPGLFGIEACPARPGDDFDAGVRLLQRLERMPCLWLDTWNRPPGCPTITGFPHDPPTMNQTAYGDPVGGFNAAAALIVALLHQQRTGEGQNIDLSQVECMLPLVAPRLIEQSATGGVSRARRQPSSGPRAAWLLSLRGRRRLAGDRGHG